MRSKEDPFQGVHSYAFLEVGYDSKFVGPLDIVLKVVAELSKLRRYEKDWKSSSLTLKDTLEDKFNVEIISEKAYKNMVANAVLNNGKTDEDSTDNK